MVSRLLFCLQINKVKTRGHVTMKRTPKVRQKTFGVHYVQTSHIRRKEGDPPLACFRNKHVRVDETVSCP